MSMFHELMMRKKEEIMYATIKGTLTENDGVFSGFSASNYLALQQQNSITPTDNFEIEIKIKYVDIASTNERIIGQQSGGFIINNQRLGLSLYDTTNTRVVLMSFSGSQFIPQDNNIYYVRLSGNNGNCVYAVYDSTHTKIVDYSFTITTTLLPFVALGNNGAKANAFNGSIDLPNSYIKLGSTKYNLQAVVGYTIVGSPTIVDGVVSGFNTGDYLQTPTIRNIDITEICMKINLPSSALGLNKYSNCLTGPIQITVYSSTTKFIYTNVNINGIGDIYFNVTGNISPNTDYWLKFVNKGAKCQTYWSTDGVNFTLGATKDNTMTTVTNKLNIGGSGSRYFEGKIYLNECYIKKNNKLWFNGQQA